MKTLIIHVGFPKTATTSLQNNFFKKLMEEGRIEYLNHINQRVEHLGNLYCQTIIQKILNGKTENLADYKEELKDLNKIDAQTTVLSAETLSIVYPGFDFGAITGYGKLNAKAIKRVFSPYFDNIKVLISIRAQRDIVQACYKQWYYWIVSEQPKFRDMHLWLADNFGHNIPDEAVAFNYAEFIGEYHDTFGENNVHTLMYEDLVYEKTEYYSKLAKLFGINENKIAFYLDGKVWNKTQYEAGMVAIDSASLRQRLVLTFKKVIIKNLGEKFYIILKKYSNNIIPKLLLDTKIRSRSISKMSNQDRLMIFAKFKPLNMPLADIDGVSETKLKRYGYL